MRICVVGAGAVGGMTGGWFAKAGHEVSLVARGAHLEAIRRRGLTLISGGKPEVLAGAVDVAGVREQVVGRAEASVRR